MTSIDSGLLKQTPPKETMPPVSPDDETKQAKEAERKEKMLDQMREETKESVDYLLDEVLSDETPQLAEYQEGKVKEFIKALEMAKGKYYFDVMSGEAHRLNERLLEISKDPNKSEAQRQNAKLLFTMVRSAIGFQSDLK